MQRDINIERKAIRCSLTKTEQTCRRHATLADCGHRRRHKLYCEHCCSPLSEIIVEKTND